MSSFGSQQTNLGNEISEEDAIKHIKRKIAVNQNIRALAESELQRQKSLVKVWIKFQSDCYSIFLTIFICRHER